MRLKRVQDDFRVFEVLDEGLLGEGEWTLYRVTKRGLTTFEAVDRIAKEAGVSRDEIAYAGFKDKDGITGQFMTVRGGRPVNYKDPQLTVRPVGKAPRALTSQDNQANSFEIVLRDLEADDMRRVRINVDQVKRLGLPAYFDDQRFGCLRHGQGFVVRKLLAGDVEGAVRDLMCAPSPYGSEAIEGFKARLARRWGHWGELAQYCRRRRGESLFAHLAEQPDDFAGALTRGISSRERTIHLFAYQSHLWNRAAALWIRSVVDPEELGWLPCDDGALPVYRSLDDSAYQALGGARLPLFGTGTELEGDARRHYHAVFRAEGVDPEGFLALDLPGFRPIGEDRPLLMEPSFLRVAPAEPDEIFKRRRKMRVRFTLPRGRYATLVAKRLVMSTERGARPPRVWVSRHCLEFPDDDGRMRPIPSGRRGSKTGSRSFPPKRGKQKR